jgi:hypothetical protein
MTAHAITAPPTTQDRRSLQHRWTWWEASVLCTDDVEVPSSGVQMITELERLPRNESSCSTGRRPDEVTSSLGSLNLTGPRSDPLRGGSHGASLRHSGALTPALACKLDVVLPWMLPITVATSPPNSSLASRLVAKIVDPTRTRPPRLALGNSSSQVRPVRRRSAWVMPHGRGVFASGPVRRVAGLLG